jgi:YYY domain-containing protein
VNTTLRDIVGFFSWYLVATSVGLISFPLAFKYLRTLRDRGYTFSRVIGLLAWGFLFWLLSSLGVLENSLSGQVLALFLLVVVCWLVIRRNRWREIFDWLRDNRKLVIASEIVFLLSFALWAFIRSANPEITGTEKPMELAFINAILRSPGIPPNDPWLSGYAISYYYFGYMLVAMLIRMTGVLPGVGFNLALALWFALSATGAYGILYNLLTRSGYGRRKDRPAGIYTVPVFGPLFLLIVANLEGFLEVLHFTGLFWKTLPDGTRVSSFWAWLDILDLSSPPTLTFKELLSSYLLNPSIDLFGRLINRYLPWWRASRVLQDYDLQGGAREIIDEFPQFSFILGDLHPHVLAIPFILLGLAISLNLFFRRSKKGLSLWGIHLPVTWDELIFIGLCLGSLGFLNTTDLPFVVLLFTGAYLLKRFTSENLSLRMLADGVLLFFLVIVTGAVLYLPFYLGFSSQVGGLIPSLIFFTHGNHFWVMFASLLLPIIAFLVWRILKQKAGRQLGDALLIAFFLIVGAFFLMLFMGWVGWNLVAIQEFLAPVIRFFNPGWVGWPDTRALLDSLFNAQGQSYSAVVFSIFIQRVGSPGTWLTLIGLLAGVLALLMRPQSVTSSVDEGSESPLPVRKIKPDFILVVMAVGLLLLIIPEFVYIRDQFGWRMNTIFKFYYHAWSLLSICAAYTFIRVLSETKGRGWSMVKTGLMIILIASLVYAPIMLDIKTNGFGTLKTRTLNGNQYFIDSYPAEAQAIEWLSQRELGVVAEAIGGSYTGYARVATLTGFPTVLGWPGHESQWRGGNTEMGTRYADIDMLYATNDWYTAEAILRQYGIRYIYIGNLEYSTYHVVDAKFRENLPVIYEQDGVVIFEVVLNNE